jgi:hypothetical protein
MTADAHELHLLEQRFGAAAELLEGERWSEGMSLLFGVVSEAGDSGLAAVEALARALLAQALFHTGDPVAAADQATTALRLAESTGDRDTIHRCMALAESLRIIQGGRL